MCDFCSNRNKFHILSLSGINIARHRSKEIGKEHQKEQKRNNDIGSKKR